MARSGSSRGSARSAISGRYVTKATAARSPRTTVVSSGRNKSSGTAYRSAISGKYVTKAPRSGTRTRPSPRTADAHPTVGGT